MKPLASPLSEAYHVSCCPFLHLLQCDDDNVEFFSLQDRHISDEMHPYILHTLNLRASIGFRN